MIAQHISIMRPLTLLAALTLSLTCRAGPAPAVGRHASSEAAFAVNSWLIPTASGLLVVDTQFTVSEAEKLAAAVIATGRPLKAIIVTHPHPDHFNGTCRLLKIAKVPVYATASTVSGISQSAEAKRRQWKPRYGADYPDETCLPDSPLPASGTLEVDGLQLRCRDYGPGEASTESICLAPSLKAAFVGDLLYQDVHPWLAEGRSARWLEQLERLRREVPHECTLYPGHGPQGDLALLNGQKAYIVDFRRAVKEALSPSSPTLSLEATQGIVAQFKTRYPHWSLEMLIPINADAVAREGSGDGAR